MAKNNGRWMWTVFASFWLFLVSLCCSGFAGFGDYEFDVAGGYRVVRGSADWVVVMRQHGGRSEGNYIPSKVVEVGWDRQFIIAKQLGFRTKLVKQRYVSEPDESNVNYWILDTSIEKAYGPYNLKEFEKNRQLLGVASDTILKRVSSYPKKPVEGEWIAAMILFIPVLIVLGPIIVLFWLIGRAIVTECVKLLRWLK